MQANELTRLQWKALDKVREAEQQGHAAEIADGLRDFLVAQELILPAIDQHHRITEKAKSLFQAR
ncbi:hypothetical protein LG198_12150 [Methylobacillus arboreus]|uniref:hypothetical protein n=1 Tax=Methylobacillus arboreus TaxID=755170 RepID=UPI001E5A97E2|nr:hypothetical protein [Methylobacillus arboreus]MCB5191481.1 hypothetical protein [Methylobacillus arboreus]